MTLPQSVVKNMVKFQAKNTIPIFAKIGKPTNKGLFGAPTSENSNVGLVSIASLVYQLNYSKKLK